MARNDELLALAARLLAASERETAETISSGIREKLGAMRKHDTRRALATMRVSIRRAEAKRTEETEDENR